MGYALNGTKPPVLTVVLTLMLVLVCASVTADSGTGDAVGHDYRHKKVLHIDSYHLGNAWNDGIREAIQQTLANTGVTLKVIHMDTKRNSSLAFKQAAALKAKRVIEAFQPDVVTASDDNATRYLIMPYYKNAALPFVFCGLNWDASSYGLPYRNVTGMVEVSPVPQIIELLASYASGDRVGYLSEDTPTKRKELEYHRRLFGIEYHKVYLADSFSDWQDYFLRAQNDVDMLIILGVAALDDWDDNRARQLAETQTRIPSGTDFSWLMPVSLLGVGKSPQEQGRWAAQAALKILDGVPPSHIPLSHNKQGTLYFNPRIGQRLGIDEPPLSAHIVD